MLHRRLPGSFAGVLSVLSVGLLLSGCGSKTGTAAASTTTTAANGRAAFNACLTQHGIDPSAVPNFGGRRGGGSSTTAVGASTTATIVSSTTRPTMAPNVQAAVDACRSQLPQGNGGGGPGGPGGGFNSAYRQCLQQHGVQFTPGQAPPNTADAATQAALQACSSLRPARGTSTTAAATTTTAAG